MIRYYHRLLATASAETDARAAWLIAHGWQRCTEVQHRALWRARDLRTLRAMRDALPPRERAVGETVVGRPLGDGWTEYIFKERKP